MWRTVWGIDGMIGAVVVLYNPTKEEVNNINTYKNLVSHTVIIDNSNANKQKMVDEIHEKGIFINENDKEIVE